MTDGSERPIAFASKSLTATERNYTQIDQEALSLIWGVKKFNQYLYGKHFTLITDHQLLVAIFSPSKSVPVMAAARLKRWALFLGSHDYSIKFKGTKYHGDADGLSRLPQEKQEEVVDDTDMFHSNRTPACHECSNSMLQDFFITAGTARPQVTFVIAGPAQLQVFFVAIDPAQQVLIIADGFTQHQVSIIVDGPAQPPIPLSSSVCIIPNMMKTFLFDSQYISFNACLVNMFFFFCLFLFSAMQSLTFVVMAYDHLIAICLPLRYHVFVNNTNICLLFLAIFLLNFFIVAMMVSLITRISFCKTNVIQSYFCDHGPMYRLACNDNSINKIMGLLYTSLYLIAPLLIIILSYLCIFYVVSKIATWEGRFKALKTCVSHLLLVGIYFIPIFFTYINSFWVSLLYSTPNSRIISTSLAYAVPAMLNPIIYVLNTAEIRDKIRKVLENRSAPPGITSK
ncbi:olfactory receptor 52E8-like [Chanodichthys erythropterus]|uniref:olfactory receptor 52E8-like n=1 Tax=Chanodichthys erythropterus TaxID=933992 RepID=UPI00351DD01A